jgi:hypothetical protein
MREGSLSFIEGAREICALAYQVGLDCDPDVIVFVGIESETDALPMGDVRKLWQEEALRKLQPEIDHAEAWARASGSAACESLIARFNSRQDAGAPRDQSSR